MINAGKELFSEAQVRGQVALTSTSAILSIFGSSCIVFQVLIGKSTKKIYRRLMLGLSTVDLISSCFFAVLAPLGFSSNREPSTLCTVEGAVNLLFMMSPLYSAVLSFYFLLTIRYGITERRLVKIEPYCHVLVLIFPIVITFWAIYLKTLNPSYPYQLGCWVNTYPQKCVSEGNCERGERGDEVAVGAVIIPLVICVMAVILSNVLVFMKVRKVQKKSQAHRFDTTNVFRLFMKRPMFAENGKINTPNHTPGPKDHDVHERDHDVHERDHEMNEQSSNSPVGNDTYDIESMDPSKPAALDFSSSSGCIQSHVTEQGMDKHLQENGDKLLRDVKLAAHKEMNDESTHNSRDALGATNPDQNNSQSRLNSARRRQSLGTSSSKQTREVAIQSILYVGAVVSVFITDAIFILLIEVVDPSGALEGRYIWLAFIKCALYPLQGYVEMSALHCMLLVHFCIVKSLHNNVSFSVF